MGGFFYLLSQAFGNAAKVVFLAWPLMMIGGLLALGGVLALAVGHIVAGAILTPTGILIFGAGCLYKRRIDKEMTGR